MLFRSLPLERESVALFPLNWTVVHPIDENSELHNCTVEKLKNMHAEFIVMITGFDESYHQNVYANRSYIYSEILENVRFVQMYTPSDEEAAKLYLDMLSDTEEM